MSSFNETELEFIQLIGSGQGRTLFNKINGSMSMGLLVPFEGWDEIRKKIDVIKKGEDVVKFVRKTLFALEEKGLIFREKDYNQWQLTEEGERLYGFIG